MQTPEGDLVEAVIYSAPIMSGDTTSDHYHIVDLDDRWATKEATGGRYWLTLGTCEYRSDDLGSLEILLAEFMASEGAEIPEDMETIHGGKATLYETSGEAAAEADSRMTEDSMTLGRTHPASAFTRMELAYHRDVGEGGRWTARVSNESGNRMEVL